MAILYQNVSLIHGSRFLHKSRRLVVSISNNEDWKFRKFPESKRMGC